MSEKIPSTNSPESSEESIKSNPQEEQQLEEGLPDVGEEVSPAELALRAKITDSEPDAGEGTSAEGGESSEEHAQEALAEAIAPEDATPEEKRGFKDALKEKWDSIAQKKIMGAPLGDFAAGLVFGGGISYAARTAMRASLGFGTAAVAGAIAGAGKRYAVKEFREYKFGSAEKAFDYDPGSLIDRVKKNKISAADALTLIADWKSERSKDAKDDEIMDMLNVEDAIIKSQDSYAKLKGVDKVEAYYTTVTTSINRHLVSQDEQAKMLAERDKKQSEISEDIAHMSGRRVTGKEYGKAALTGAIGGLLGATVAHAISGFFHHDVVPTNAGVVKQAAEVAHSHAGEAAAMEHAGPTVGEMQAEAPHTGVPEAAPSPAEEVRVKGTVWGTLKEYFKSKGLNPNDEQLNAATRYIAHENHIGIAADHPAASSYEVLDTKIADGTMLHGVDKLDLDHIPRVPVAPHEVLTHDAVIPVEAPAPINLDPTELALKAGINPVEYAQMGAGDMHVGDVVNTVADASEHGSIVDMGMRLSEMSPTGDEMKMTIEEFLKHRAEAAAMGSVDVVKHINDHIAEGVNAAHTSVEESISHLKETIAPHVAAAEVGNSMKDNAGDAIDGSLQNVEGKIPWHPFNAEEVVEQAATDSLHKEVVGGAVSAADAVSDTVTAHADTVVSHADTIATEDTIAAAPKEAAKVIKAMPKDNAWNNLLRAIGLGVLVGGAGAGGLAYVANKEFEKTSAQPESVGEPEDEIVEEKLEVKTPSVVAEAKQQTAEERSTTWNEDEFAKMSPKEQRNQVFGMIRRIEPRKIFALRKQPLERLFKDGKYDNLISSLLTKWESLPDADPERAYIEHIVDAVKIMSPLENMNAHQEFRSRVTNAANKLS